MKTFNIYYHVGYQIEADNEEEAIKIAEKDLDQLELVESVDVDEIEEVEE